MCHSRQREFVSTDIATDSTRISTGGAYDELTLWEQIDMGAQYTPAKKWLTSVPIGLYVWRRRRCAQVGCALTGRFLISTHYTNYDYTLFAINFAALIVVLFPKLPIVSVAVWASALFPEAARRSTARWPRRASWCSPPRPALLAGNTYLQRPR